MRSKWLLGATVLLLALGLFGCQRDWGVITQAPVGDLQFGDTGFDQSTGIVVLDDGSKYIVGATYSDLFGTNAGGRDFFIAKYDSDNNLVWGKQLGTTGHDQAADIAIDGDGNLYIAGYVSGDYAGSGNYQGGWDAFVAKFDSDGNQLWASQFGTRNSTDNDAAASVVLGPDGSVYIAGKIGDDNAGLSDSFVAKYDPDTGERLVFKQFGTGHYDRATAIDVDSSGNVYIAGDTRGVLFGTNLNQKIFDAYVAKYTADLEFVKGIQYGSYETELTNGLAVYDDGVYLAGYTKGNLAGENKGSKDAFVAQFDHDLNLVAALQIGTPEADEARDVAVSSIGGVTAVTVVGLTRGDMTGGNKGGSDAFAAQYYMNGHQIWVSQLGTAEDERADDVALDSSGRIYISGRTKGDLFGTNKGSYDVFLMNYDAFPASK